MTNLKIFSDFSCPFCYITLGIVEQLRKDGVQFSVEWLPLEIHPETPLDGVSLYNLISKEEADKSLIMLKRIAKNYDNVVYGDSLEYIFNTRRTLLAGEYAKTINKYEEFAINVFRSSFKYGKNIGQKEVIDEICKDLSFDINEMNYKIDNGEFDKNLELTKDLAKQFSVKEVPTFLINDKDTFINVRRYKKLKEILE